MPHKLLLADDSVTIQRVIELTFADEDIQVVAVGDGAQAIERVQAERPDIVLADIGMPYRDGYEVAEFMKAHAELSHIPVLLLTGAFEPIDDARARAVGCDGVLVKPFEPQMVISRVKELLSGKRQRKATEDAVQPGAVPVTDEQSGSVAAGAVDMGNAGAAAADAPMVAAAPTTRGNASVDDYFERLDAAFASFDSGSSARNLGGQERPDLDGAALDAASGDGTTRVPDGPAATADNDGMATISGDAATPVSGDGVATVGGDGVATVGGDATTTVHSEADARQIEAEADAVASGFGGGIQPDEIAPAPPPEASEALFTGEPYGRVSSAVERSGGAPPSGPTPSLAEVFAALLSAERGHSLQPAPIPRAEVTDDLVERVTARVIERLGERTVRDAVLEVAERLVREEIARLKASM